MRSLHIIVVGCLSLLGLTACGSKGPVDALGPVLKTLGEAGGPTVWRTRQLYDVLDGATRQAVDARAAALSAELGRRIEPDAVIQFRGFGSGLRVSSVEAEEVSADRARLKVSLSKIAGATDGLMADPVTFDAVLEEGGWKLAMPRLAAEVVKP